MPGCKPQMWTSCIWASPLGWINPAGVRQAAPEVRLAAGHAAGSAPVPQVISLASVPSSVCQATPMLVDGSACPGAPTAMLPPMPTRTRRMFGVGPTASLPTLQSRYSMRGAMVKSHPAGA